MASTAQTGRNSGQGAKHSATLSSPARLGARVPTAEFRAAGQPLMAGIEQLQAGAAVQYVDETAWPVQQVESGGGRQRWWRWVCVTAGAVRMRILPTRGSPAAQQQLRRVLERAQGLPPAACDRWSAYQSMARRAGGTVRLAWCWAHQRRDFRRVGTGYPELEA